MNNKISISPTPTTVSFKMGRAAIRVCIRVRPTERFAVDKIKVNSDENIIKIETIAPGSSKKQNSYQLKFDHVFQNADQGSIYDLKARTIVGGVIDGINGAILTYGQTGAGKTFTMVGFIFYF